MFERWKIEHLTTVKCILITVPVNVLLNYLLSCFVEAHQEDGKLYLPFPISNLLADSSNLNQLCNSGLAENCGQQLLCQLFVPCAPNLQIGLWVVLNWKT